MGWGVLNRHDRQMGQAKSLQSLSTQATPEPDSRQMMELRYQ